MARSLYLRSLAGPPPGSNSRLRPPRVSPWARPRITDPFGEDSDAPASASELSVRTHPVRAQHFHEHESTLISGPESVAEAVLPESAGVHAELLPVRSPIRRNEAEPERDSAVGPGKLDFQTRIPSAVVADSARFARINPASTPQARPAREFTLPVKPEGRTAPTARSDNETTRTIPEEWKGKLWANDEELFQSAGKSSRLVVPRTPLLPAAEEVPPAAKVEGVREGNSVHIGRLEVHVTPPLAPTPRQSVPRATAATAVLSRGFTSAFGFTQG